VHTPHLDQLAVQGVRYPRVFSTAPVCAPSRSAFMTGMYQTSVNLHHFPDHRDDGFRLPEGIRPLTHRLKDAGYLTGSIKKMGEQVVGSGKLDLNFVNEGKIFESTKWDEIKKGKWVAIAYTLLTDTSAVLIGIFGRLILTKAGDAPDFILGNMGEDLLALVLAQVMPTFVIGVYVAAVLSAVMSTVDSLLVVASSAITRDFYQKIFNPKINEDLLVSLSKKVTLVLAVLSLGVALLVSFLSPTRTVFWFVIFGWSGIAATFCPVIILSLFYEDFSERGAIASMVTGFLCVPFFKFIVPGFAIDGPYVDKLDVMFPSVYIAILVGLLTSAYVRN